MAAISMFRGDTRIEDWALTRNNVQTITIEGTPTGGAWTGTYNGETTGTIAHNANAAAVQAAFELLAHVGPGDITVSGGPGPGTPWVFTVNTNSAYELTVAGTFTGGTIPQIYVRPQAFNLTGATLRWTLKTAASQADNQATIAHLWTDGGSSNLGIVVATPSTGLAVHTLTATETAQLAPGTTYVYDVQLTDAAGRVTTVDSGTLEVKADISRTTP